MRALHQDTLTKTKNRIVLLFTRLLASRFRRTNMLVTETLFAAPCTESPLYPKPVISHRLLLIVPQGKAHLHVLSLSQPKMPGKFPNLKHCHFYSFLHVRITENFNTQCSCKKLKGEFSFFFPLIKPSGSQDAGVILIPAVDLPE